MSMEIISTNLKVTHLILEKTFQALKNYTKEQCSGDYIFHIDADEIPNEILIKQLPKYWKSTIQI